MASNMLYVQLKTALLLRGLTLTEWAANLKKPDGSVGVSHTAVSQIAKGHFESPQWIRDAIDDLIEDVQEEYPEFWDKTASLEIAETS